MSQTPKPKLYLMLGYPGAGKTTVAAIIAKLTGAYHLSSDAMRSEIFSQPEFTPKEHTELYKILNQKTIEALEAGQDVIYDANLNRLEHRQEKYQICQQVGAEPVLIWVQTPRDIARERASDTSRQHLWPQNETAGAMFDRIANVIEPPVGDETFIRVNGAHATDRTVSLALDME